MVIKMNYIERIAKLDTLDKFINGENQDDILLFLNKTYKDDKWSVICAVMHWFKVVKSYLDSENILKENTPDYNWGNVYLYICAVDIITKGINDLNKILTKDNKYLFCGEKDIFNDSILDDHKYFQNIRAIFGAHPTDLDSSNGNYIVATYPTPYNHTFDAFRGEAKDWDYYTLLWSKEKSDTLNQKAFGFSFKNIDLYLEKHLDYLDEFYEKILKLIKNYKKNTTKKLINKIDDPLKQLNLLLIEDKKRLGGKYGYIIRDIIKLISIEISDNENEKLYKPYRRKILSCVNKLYKAIQYPNRKNEINNIESLIENEIEDFDNMTHYYYSKLLEYENNLDMKDLLIDYFKDKLIPFNSNVKKVSELYCLIKASNYFKSQKNTNDNILLLGDIDKFQSMIIKESDKK